MPHHEVPSADAECAVRDEPLLERIVSCLNLLLAAKGTIHDAIHQVLAILCQAVQADRAYVFELHAHSETGELLSSQRYEWCSDAVASQVDNQDLQDHHIEKEFPRWCEILGRGGTISGRVADFPELERLILEPQDIVSLLVVPIMVENGLWGFIGFDDCFKDRSWTRTDELGLKAAAAGIGSAIVRHRADAAAAAASSDLERKVRERTRQLEQANLKLQQEVEERIAAKQALKESESRLRAAVESLPFEFFALDESGRYVLQNRACVANWGNIIGMRPEDLVQKEVLSQWEENNRRAFAGETVSRDIQITSGGRRLTLHNIITPIRIDGVIKGILGINIDVTDQKSAQLALARAKEEMRLQVEERTAELVLVNQQLREEILVHEQAREELHEREQEFRALVEHAPDVIIRVDEKLRILYVNPALQSSTGYPRRWFLGRSIAALGLPSRRMKQISRSLRMVFATGRERVLEVEFETADHSRKFFQFRLTPEHSRAGGKVTSVLGIGRDITAQKMLETRLRTANRAKNEFMANMSHELRTPLGGILGLVKLALNNTLPERLRHDLEMIDASGRALLHLINDILDLSRIEAGRLEMECRCVELRELLESMLEPFSMQAGARGLGFRLAIPPELPPVIRADPFRLGQILRNLVSNALKFTEEGGISIDVSCGPGSSGGKSVKLSFSVTDTGIGIAQTDQRKLFRSFSQLDASRSKRYEGVGLGLVICRKLARSMGGDIELSSRKGKGSRFTFAAEFETGVLPEPLTADEAEREPPGRLKVLLAEDNPVNTAYILRFLAEEGHAVTSVQNGREALDALGKERYDLVLMDVQMPEMDGVEATRRIRSAASGVLDRKIPVIALTAYAMKSDRELFMQAGMDDHITKPIDFDLLRRVLEKERRSPSAP
jgi:PAS domain S-box-containing protein